MVVVAVQGAPSQQSTTPLVPPSCFRWPSAFRAFFCIRKGPLKGPLSSSMRSPDLFVIQSNEKELPYYLHDRNFDGLQLP